MKVRECMKEDVCFLNPNSTVLECAKLMSENHIGCVPVCNDNNNIVGLVTDRDVILRSIACDKDVKTTRIKDIMTTDVWYCNYNAPLDEVEGIMSRNQIRRLPIVDDNSKIVGIITLGDLIKNKNIDNNSISNTFETICRYDNKNAQ